MAQTHRRGARRRGTGEQGLQDAVRALRRPAAASGPSPAPWSTVRRSSWPTSRPATSTRGRPRRSWEVFRRIVEGGCSIVMSTHNVANIEQFPSRTIRFSQGQDRGDRTLPPSSEPDPATTRRTTTQKKHYERRDKRDKHPSRRVFGIKHSGPRRPRSGAQTPGHVHRRHRHPRPAPPGLRDRGHSIDEALAGYCTHIEVTINEQQLDHRCGQRRGIPVDFHEKEGKSALEVVLTVLHAGGKIFQRTSYKVSGGLHGVGMSCADMPSRPNSKWRSGRNGKIHRQTYKHRRLRPLRSRSSAPATTRARRSPSCPTLRSSPVTEYSYDILSARSARAGLPEQGHPAEPHRPPRAGRRRQTSAARPSIRPKASRSSSATSTPTAGTPLTEDVIYIDTEKDSIPVEVAMQYNDSFSGERPLPT